LFNQELYVNSNDLAIILIPLNTLAGRNTGLPTWDTHTVTTTFQGDMIHLGSHY